MDRHKVFISYHHDNDQKYYDALDAMFGGDFFINGSVKDGDIDDNLQTETIRQKIRDNYLRNTTVTLVLVGTETAKRKYVDWEISSSIRNTTFNPRSGLLGIILPTVPRDAFGRVPEEYIPPRLLDNVKKGYAKLYNWPSSAYEFSEWIDIAFQAKDNPYCLPDNSRDLFGKNRPTTFSYFGY